MYVAQKIAELEALKRMLQKSSDKKGEAAFLKETMENMNLPLDESAPILMSLKESSNTTTAKKIGMVVLGFIAIGLLYFILFGVLFGIPITGAVLLGVEDTKKESGKPYNRGKWVAGIVLVVIGGFLWTNILAASGEYSSYINLLIIMGVAIAGAALVGVENPKKQKNLPYNRNGWITGIVLLSVFGSLFVINAIVLLIGMAM